MFSVAPTLGNPNVTSAPCSRSANASTSPWLNLNVAPIASSPATCRSIGRAPKSSPPGIERRTRPHRVSSGPSTLIDALMRSTCSYGATGTRSPAVDHPQPTAAERLGRDADGRQQLAHDRHVDDRRHVGQLVGAVGEDRRRHQLEDRVLRTWHLDGAVQVADAAHHDLIGTHRSDHRRTPRNGATAAQYAPAVPGGGHGPDTGRVRQVVREWPDEPGVASTLERPREDLLARATRRRDDRRHRLRAGRGPVQHLPPRRRRRRQRRRSAVAGDDPLPAGDPVVRLAVRPPGAGGARPSRRRPDAHRPPTARSRRRRGGRRPTASTRGRSACSACWLRRRCRRPSSTRCSPRRSSSPPTTSGSVTSASASAGRSCGPASCSCCRSP